MSSIPSDHSQALYHGSLKTERLYPSMTSCPLRSTLFNVLFLLLVGLECVICLPTLLLPRKMFLHVVHGFVHSVTFLERWVMGLTYEVRGIEHLPQDGAFIVAAKHQSAYETMKLHILFKDPAVILKKELLSIPLWGAYLKKSDVIAIDRSTPDKAISSIQDGAKRMMAQGRPIVIFPQGTRVSIHETPAEKPYKVGIARIQEATGLPIIPLALNTGYFWPRKGWRKSSGTVIFQFLKPLPAGLERKELMTEIEKTLEGESLSLLNEAREKTCCAGGSLKYKLGGLALLAVVLFGAYSAMWFNTAKTLVKEYPKTIVNLNNIMPGLPAPVPATPTITGYPGKIKISVPSETIKTPQMLLKVTDLRAEGWPLPFMPVTLTTGLVEFSTYKWAQPLVFDRLSVKFRQKGDIITLLDSALEKDSFMARITGDINLKQKPVPVLNLTLGLTNHAAFLETLSGAGIIEPRMALFFSAGLSALADQKTGLVTVPLIQKSHALYAGPLPIMTFPPEIPAQP